MKMYFALIPALVFLNACTDPKIFQPSNPNTLDKVEEQMQVLREHASKGDRIASHRNQGAIQLPNTPFNQ